MKVTLEFHSVEDVNPPLDYRSGGVKHSVIVLAKDEEDEYYMARLHTHLDGREVWMEETLCGTNMVLSGVKSWAELPK